MPSLFAQAIAKYNLVPSQDIDDMTFFEIIYKLSIEYYNPHALLLWIFWNLVSILLVGSVRWWRHHPKVMTAVHVVSGTVTIGLTIWLGIRACLHLKAKEMHWDAHAICGLFVLGSIAVPLITGAIVSYMRCFSKWKTKILLGIRVFHKYFGYVQLLAGFVACESGIYYYFDMKNDKLAWPLTIANAVFTVLVCLVFEWVYRC